MTHHRPPDGPDDPAADGAPPVIDLERLDERARTAAEGLHDHVRRRVDLDAAVAGLPPTGARRRAARPRSRVLAVAAVAAIVVGVMAVSSGPGEDGRDRVDTDRTRLDLTPGLLRPMGPHDGKDSIQLPVDAVPDVGLHDGDEVTVSASGFVPGESVGLVQCAREAGGPTPETRGGADGCYISQYTNLTADDQGAATGTYRVRRILTTPLTGTVDCAAEVGRCMVAMGAISDYDRSGGHPIEFATDVAPVEVPTATVVPSEDLADGQTVHVSVDGMVPDQVATLEVCSSDPLACWSTGRPVRAAIEDGYSETLGLQVDRDGHLEGDVAVWRFLPGSEPGTYVDCAVSRCALRIAGTPGTAPPPVPLHFRGDEPAPVAPSFGIDPSTGLAPGDEVAMAGAGFAPGSQLWVSICTVPVGSAEIDFRGYETCSGSQAEPITVDETGAFAGPFTIPDPGARSGPDQCNPDGTCTTGGPGDPIRCDDVATRCVLNIDIADGRAASPGPVGPPIFPAVPIPITFR